MSAGERFLVTGALGCIGAWTVRSLAEEGTPVVAFDQAADTRRLRDISTREQYAAVTFVNGDITDLSSIESALDEHGITHVVHLAALQVPACRANPPLGALVNVVGTVNVLEAVRRCGEQIRQLVYTGSMGMFGPDDADRVSGMLEPDAVPHPGNHYGVFKQANENNARVYWAENGVSSIGLRPMTVYGPGRDFGVTSTPTKAIAAAVSGRPYTISFGGSTVFQLADDVGRTLLMAARSGLTGARLFNMGGTLSSIRNFIAMLEDEVPEARGTIDSVDAALPFPERISDRGLDEIGDPPITSLRDGIRNTADFFRDQIARGTFSAEKHGLEPLAAGSLPKA
jgi:nucleoside-diphosphate-sugar epimerase